MILWGKRLRELIERATAAETALTYKDRKIEELHASLEEKRNMNDRLLALVGDLKREGYRPEIVGDLGLWGDRKEVELTPGEKEIDMAIDRVATRGTELWRSLHGFADDLRQQEVDVEQVVGQILAGGVADFEDMH